MQTLRAIRAVWLVTVLAGVFGWLAMGCGGGALDDGGGECGPREDLIGGWRSADGTELRIELDATFELRKGGLVRGGRYQVSDTLLRLIFESGADPKAKTEALLESRYCVSNAGLSIAALGMFTQTD